MHIRITCPPVKWPCFYGIDMPTRQELIGADLAVEEIRAYVGAESLGYLSLEGMVEAAGDGKDRFCRACFDGEYPIPIPAAGRQVRAGGPAPPPHVVTSYRDAGVDIEAAAKAVTLIGDLASRARRPEVADEVGGFAGLFRIGQGRMLAAATDGVGTKLEIARMTGRLDTVGIDLVAMCADDVVCTGAEPLFFLDYLAVGKVVPERVAALVEGVAEGCRRAGCALAGRGDGRAPRRHARRSVRHGGVLRGLPLPRLTCSVPPGCGKATC